MINEYIQKIKKGGYKRLVNVIENILLRPNDQKLLMGEDKYNKYVEAAEQILEEYKDNELYKYYYGLNKIKHGFYTFNRWKAGLYY